MKIGQTARLVQPVIAGEIKDKRWNKYADEPEVLLSWSDGDGAHERWFLESQLEEVA